MVVNMIKCVPWSPLSSTKFQTKIIINHVQDLSKGGQDSSSLSVEVKWYGSSNRISFKRGSVKRDMTKGGIVNDDGVLVWNEEFDHVCDLLRVGVNDGGFCQWDIGFKVFNGLKQGPKGRGNVVATGSLNLAEFAYAEQEKTLISIPLSVRCGTESSPILSISLCLLELRTEHDTKQLQQNFVGDEPLGLKAGFKKCVPWSPLSSTKFQTKIIIHHVQDLSKGGQDGSSLSVEVKWKGSSNRISLKRGSVKRDMTKGGLVNDDGVVVWNEEFDHVCDLLKVDVNDGGFCQWDVGFKVFNGLKQGPKGRGNVVATGSLNLAEFIYAEQEKTLISIPLSVPSGIESSPILSISLCLLELRTEHDTKQLQQNFVGGEPLGLKAGFKKVKIFRAFSPNRAKKSYCEEGSSDGKSSVRSSDYPFDSDSFDGTDETDSEEMDNTDFTIKKSLSYENLAHVNHVGGSYIGDRIYYQSYNSKADVISVSANDRAEKQISKRSIFPWRKRKLSFKAKGEPLLKREIQEEGGDDIDFDRRMLTSSDESSYGWHRSDGGSTTSRSSISEFGDDNFVVGKWDNTEVINRDGLMSLQTQVFFASIDQRSERASGESACTSLVATIATWFQNNHNQMPIKSELDTLVREGSLEWRDLCENEVYRKRFPDKHFDLETVLESKTRNLEVVPEKSFVGFFQLEEGTFDFLDGAMSFDNIWDEVSQSESDHVYIVSWNDHFFILKVERDAYYIIDTLGERLYEGCNQAYVLKFDKDTTIQRLSVDSQKSNEKVEHSLVSKGKESCKEYIKSFLAAIPLRELQTDVKKGLMAASSPLVHHRLQIEFHYTKCLEVNTNMSTIVV
ncbi:EEIG1/EHBP1 N-terminal domain-containing protein [Artemisia annua]|uniref:EEIG1/EHBP1 N-terminal domain-containing protein n=1 Tax=Artemisia annua TaxID=35608 RepID=A0A2U1QI74_ARTAN|nr:EEIG1/EHBP1 N-terminal domain-containing protein [Artemisia annua]